LVKRLGKAPDFYPTPRISQLNILFVQNILNYLFKSGTNYPNKVNILIILERIFHMVDNKDMLILQALKENARASVVEVAKKTGLPSTTVHNRIKKLRKDDVIESYTIKINNKKIGREIAAYILVKLDYQLLRENKTTEEEITLEMANLPGIEEANTITGQSDTILKVRVKDMDELNKLVTTKLRNLDCVEKSETMVVLQEVRD